MNDAGADWLAGATSKLLAAMRPYLAPLLAAVPIIVASGWGYATLARAPVAADRVRDLGRGALAAG